MGAENCERRSPTFERPPSVHRWSIVGCQFFLAHRRCRFARWHTHRQVLLAPSLKEREREHFINARWLVGRNSQSCSSSSSPSFVLHVVAAELPAVFYIIRLPHSPSPPSLPLPLCASSQAKVYCCKVKQQDQLANKNSLHPLRRSKTGGGAFSTDRRDCRQRGNNSLGAKTSPDPHPERADTK